MSSITGRQINDDDCSSHSCFSIRVSAIFVFVLFSNKCDQLCIFHLNHVPCATLSDIGHAFRRSREAASGANDQHGSHSNSNGNTHNNGHGIDAADDAIESGRATRFLAYSTGNKVVGLLRLGLDGNPAKVLANFAEGE
jgi:hypothetical protein